VDRRGHRVLQVRWVHRVFKVIKVLLVLLALQVQEVFREQLANKDSQAQKEIPVLLVA
jgi:hypothetical protein